MLNCVRAAKSLRQKRSIVRVAGEHFDSGLFDFGKFVLRPAECAHFLASSPERLRVLFAARNVLFTLVTHWFQDLV
jgi:hypothetical protein